MKLPVTLGLTFLLCFVAGTASSVLRSRLFAIPYCRVATNAESYHGKFIRVKANLIFGSNGMYVFESCDPVEALASRIEFAGVERLPQPRDVDEGSRSAEKEQVQSAEAIIEGVFDAYATPGCWAPKFRIAATKVELMSSARYQWPSSQ